MAAKLRVLVPLGPGFEETEAITVVDYLRRAGAHVVTASVDTPNPITGQNRIRVLADIDLSEALAEWGDAWDLIVLPGGQAVDHLAKSETLMALIRGRVSQDLPIAAICAAPRLLRAAGLATETAITNYPGCAADLSDFANYSDEAVVRAGQVVTSRGPGTAVAFALACVETLFGAETAASIRSETVSD
ncbi:MAG: 4-methyl-5(b-hydroxyethyl)-thiazole monophosphate biosynthesis [Myxococcota bacterium]|jgi:4-methyl-5(b-hydroxyethyl)-thiazole monophosphate biosynthesis